jgi:DnaK suppressor protein
VNIAEFETLLRDLLRQLQASPDNDAGATVILDQTRVGRLSRMDALQGQAMAKATSERRQVEIRRIEAALQRIDNGAYGYCLQCDEAVAELRLRADPATALCIECAAKREEMQRA